MLIYLKHCFFNSQFASTTNFFGNKTVYMKILMNIAGKRNDLHQEIFLAISVLLHVPFKAHLTHQKHFLY